MQYLLIASKFLLSECLVLALIFSFTQIYLSLLIIALLPCPRKHVSKFMYMMFFCFLSHMLLKVVYLIVINRIAFLYLSSSVDEGYFHNFSLSVAPQRTSNRKMYPLHHLTSFFTLRLT